MCIFLPPLYSANIAHEVDFLILELNAGYLSNMLQVNLCQKSNGFRKMNILFSLLTFLTIFEKVHVVVETFYEKNKTEYHVIQLCLES